MWTIELGPDYAKQRKVRPNLLDWSMLTTPRMQRCQPSSSIMTQRPKYVDLWIAADCAPGDPQQTHRVRCMRNGAIAFMDCPHGSVGQQRIALLLGIPEVICRPCMSLLHMLQGDGADAYFHGAGICAADLRRMWDGTAFYRGTPLPGSRRMARKRGMERVDGSLRILSGRSARYLRNNRDRTRDALQVIQPGRFSKHNLRLSTQAMADASWERGFQRGRQSWRMTFGEARPHQGMEAAVSVHQRGWGKGSWHGTINLPTAWRFLWMRGCSLLDGFFVGAIASHTADRMEAWVFRVGSPGAASDFHLADFERAVDGRWRFVDWRRGWSWRTVLQGKTKTHRAMLERMFRPDGSMRVMPDGFTLNVGIIGGV
jgi:hypothetical protein